MDILPGAMAFADRLADTSRAILREAVRTRQSFDTKSDSSPVTEVDRRVEQALRERIEAAYPAHGIFGEEFGSQGVDNEYVWVLDPIDGTKAFISGIPIFGTLIALAHRGVPVLGVIDNPVTCERWVGAEGMPTTLNGVAVTTRADTLLPDAILSTGSPDPYRGMERNAFERLRSSVKWCVYGGSCHAYGRLANGAIDILVDAGLDPFDYCALAPIVRGAGGIITDWEGQPLTIHSGSRCVAAGSAALHAQAMALLA